MRKKIQIGYNSFAGNQETLEFKKGDRFSDHINTDDIMIIGDGVKIKDGVIEEYRDINFVPRMRGGMQKVSKTI